ncbi:hypothetical protein HY504_03440 [Candidatus Wolfebacteria bacterium]|nr:hypothetical protein [Candidatus Wolfebacteria bacterium]
MRQERFPGHQEGQGQDEVLVLEQEVDLIERRIEAVAASIVHLEKSQITSHDPGKIEEDISGFEKTLAELKERKEELARKLVALRTKDRGEKIAA